jgi:predicted hydrolase (HD superfamily)
MRAKPHLRLKKVGARLLPDYYSPETVLPGIRDEATLRHALDRFANPFIKLHTADNTQSRRHHVEKVRPALRWYCKKFGVDEPEWLKGNAHYDEIPPEEHEALFGKNPLKTREFEEWKTEPADPEAG